MDWTGILLGLGLVLTLVAIAALRLVTDAGRAVLVCIVLLLVEWWADRSVRVAAARAENHATT
jgi:hypothetical protein